MELKISIKFLLLSAFFFPAHAEPWPRSRVGWFYFKLTQCYKELEYWGLLMHVSAQSHFAQCQRNLLGSTWRTGGKKRWVELTINKSWNLLFLRSSRHRSEKGPIKSGLFMFGALFFVLFFNLRQSFYNPSSFLSSGSSRKIELPGGWSLFPPLLACVKQAAVSSRCR